MTEMVRFYRFQDAQGIGVFTSPNEYDTRCVGNCWYTRCLPPSYDDGLKHISALHYYTGREQFRFGFTNLSILDYIFSYDDRAKLGEFVHAMEVTVAVYEVPANCVIEGDTQSVVPVVNMELIDLLTIAEF